MMHDGVYCGDWWWFGACGKGTVVQCWQNCVFLSRLMQVGGWGDDHAAGHADACTAESAWLYRHCACHIICHVVHGSWSSQPDSTSARALLLPHHATPCSAQLMRAHSTSGYALHRHHVPGPPPCRSATAATVARTTGCWSAACSATAWCLCAPWWTRSG